VTVYPIEGAEGADAAGFGEQDVPGGAAGVEDIVVARPETMREEALAQVPHTRSIAFSSGE
jgi:hypothetical protein